MEMLLVENDDFQALTSDKRKTLEMCVNSLIQSNLDEKEKLYRLMSLINSFEKDVRLECGYRIVKMLSEREN